MFVEEMMGKGIAILPAKGRVIAPVNGKVVSVFPTKHVIIIQANDGVELIIHVGLNTVNLGGKHYKTYVKDGDEIKVGQLLVEFDEQSIKDAGYDTVTPIVVLNSSNDTAVELLAEGSVDALDLFLSIN